MPKGYSVNPKKDKRGLLKPQQVFADNVLAVGKEEAARMAYPNATPKSQGEIASRNLAHPEIILSISKTLELQGVKDETLCQAIKRGLEEDSPKAYLKAAELGFRLKGHLKDNNQAAVQVTKDVFVDLCKAYWATKPSGTQ